MKSKDPMQVPSYYGTQPDFPADANYDSATPKQVISGPTATELSIENSWSDYTAQHIKLDNAALLKIRNMAYNAAETWPGDGSAGKVPNFEASEPED